VLKHRALFLGLMAVLVAGFALGGEAIPNWPAPATWTPPSSAGVHTMTDISLMEPFIAVTPCRIWDTRGNGFVGAYGPPSIGANTQRNFVIVGASGCGIPASAVAVSFNIGALNVSAAGDLRVFPAGGAVPLVSTLNYNANTPNIANAAVVPLGAGGAITLQADGVTIDSIGDVNGYYAAAGATTGNFFAVVANYASAGGVIFGENTNTTVADSYGGNFFSNSTGTGSAGVHGQTSATTGNTWGVLGNTNNGTAASGGVRGVTKIPFVTGGTNEFTWDGPSGVIGRTGSGNGVAGLQSGTCCGGVIGTSTDTAGNNAVWAWLGVHFLGAYAVYGEGAAHFTGGVVAPTSTVAQPHPLDASKEIDYSALTGPRSEVYFRGTADISKGMTTITVPDDFALVASPDSYSTLVTPVGAMASVAVVSEDANGIVVQASKDVTIHYVVYAERKLFRGQQAVVANTHFRPFFEGRYFSNMPDVYQQMMIKNGTLNPDHTVNTEKARAVGWTLFPESENRMVPTEEK
jgi:hypothetical protein